MTAPDSSPAVSVRWATFSDPFGVCGWVRTAPADRNLDVIAPSVHATERLFAIIDAHLASRRFMLGESFTMADIPLGCEAHRWFGLPPSEYTRPAWPNVERWFGELKARSGARGVLDLALE